jgi:hypothetical protein
MGSGHATHFLKWILMKLVQKSGILEVEATVRLPKHIREVT